MKWQTRNLDEIDPRGSWLPIRRELGIGAFGVNGWQAREAGEAVIDEHDEVPSGHEEVYVVLAGRATFTLDGEELDAPPGTIVAVHDPAVRRKAVAAEPGTRILAVGATPGQAFEPRSWEENAEVIPLFEAGDWEGAKAKLLELRERDPESAGLLYNLACAESMLGETDAAIEHLLLAIERNPPFAEHAQADTDFEPIRADPRFPTRPPGA